MKFGHFFTIFIEFWRPRKKSGSQIFYDFRMESLSSVFRGKQAYEEIHDFWSFFSAKIYFRVEG